MTMSMIDVALQEAVIAHLHIIATEAMVVTIRLMQSPLLTDQEVISNHENLRMRSYLEIANYRHGTVIVASRNCETWQLRSVSSLAPDLKLRHCRV